MKEGRGRFRDRGWLVFDGIRSVGGGAHVKLEE